MEYIIYFGIGIAVVSVATVILAYLDPDSMQNEDVDILFVYLLSVIFWPILLACAVMMGLVFGSINLGLYLRGRSGREDEEEVG